MNARRGAWPKSRQRAESAQRARPRVTGPEDVHTGIALGDTKELNLILKADVQGSVEAARSSLEKLDEDGAKVRVLHAASGAITESDVLLASASKAMVVGFATNMEPSAERVADREGVHIKRYDIIYHMIEDIEATLKGLLEPVQREGGDRPGRDTGHLLRQPCRKDRRVHGYPGPNDPRGQGAGCCAMARLFTRGASPACATSRGRDGDGRRD